MRLSEAQLVPAMLALSAINCEQLDVSTRAALKASADDLADHVSLPPARQSPLKLLLRRRNSLARVLSVKHRSNNCYRYVSLDHTTHTAMQHQTSPRSLVERCRQGLLRLRTDLRL